MADQTAPGISLLVKALHGNTGIIYWGGTAVSSSNGLELKPGEHIIADINPELGEVWIDAATSGDKVSWVLLS